MVNITAAGLGPLGLGGGCRHAGDPLHQRHPRNSAMVKTDMARPSWPPGRTSARPHTAAPCSPTAPPHRQRAATSSRASCHAHGRKRCRHQHREAGKPAAACRGRGPMRPKNAGLNSDTSDMAVTTCPLATSDVAVPVNQQRAQPQAAQQHRGISHQRQQQDAHRVRQQEQYPRPAHRLAQRFGRCMGAVSAWAAWGSPHLPEDQARPAPPAASTQTPAPRRLLHQPRQRCAGEQHASPPTPWLRLTRRRSATAQSSGR